MESFLSAETIEAVKSKIEDVVEAAVTLSLPYKIVLVGTGVVIGLYWYATRTHGYFRKLGVPGPKPGLFGAFGDYNKKGFQAYDRETIKKYGKVVGIFHGPVPLYLISDPEMIRQITVKKFYAFVNRNDETVPNDPLVKNSVGAANGDHWKFLRNIVTPTFTSGRMRAMSPLIQKCVDALTRHLWKSSEEGTKSLKMKEIFSMYTMDVIATTAFGVEVDCLNEPDNVFFKNATKLVTPGVRTWAIVFLCSVFTFMGPVLKFLGIRIVDPSVARYFVEVVNETIKHRREDNVTRNDFLQLMLNSHNLELSREDKESDSYLEFDRSKRRGMTDDEILGNATVFIFAGYETTSITLTYMAYCLATNPDCQEKLIEEVDKVLKGKAPDYDDVAQLQYLENVFLETLRMFPPAVRTTRITNEDVEINGYQFKKGMNVHFAVSALHYDPDYWPNPEKFDPDRFLPENRPENLNYVFLPFGVGPRNCIGMRLAYMQAKMAIAGILQKYRFKPAPETKIPPDLEKASMKPKDGMVLMIEKR